MVVTLIDKEVHLIKVSTGATFVEMTQSDAFCDYTAHIDNVVVATAATKNLPLHQSIRGG